MSLNQNVDLNLFRLFHTLYEERSVARAAERSFITPSAVSHALRRLRLLFSDDLFIRTPGGMVPTPRAREVADQLRVLLPQLADVLTPLRFDPGTTNRVFTIACVPYITTILAPILAAYFAREAPNAKLDLKLLSDTVVDDLSDGAVDVVIGAFRRTPPQLVAEELLRDSYVWVMRRANPLATHEITLHALSEVAHVDIVIAGATVNPHSHYDVRQGLERLIVQSSMTVTEQAFAEAGLYRKVRFQAPDSLSAMAIAAGVDAACIVPAGIARKFGTALDLVAITPPYRSARLVLQMLYHAELGERPAVRWLLDLLREATSAEGGKALASA